MYLAIVVLDDGVGIVVEVQQKYKSAALKYFMD